MQSLRTVLLRHSTPGGVHHDWMIEDPAAANPAEALLWTARVGPESTKWRAQGGFAFEVLPPHRRVYLEYEGAISGGRGEVVRVDAGWVVVKAWQPRRKVLEVAMEGFRGELELVFASDSRGEAKILNEKVQPLS